MELDAKIYVAGHRGVVGSAILRKLKSDGYNCIVFKTHDELNLRDSKAVDDFFKLEKPDYVFLAAAKVGGIHANDTYPVDFLIYNLEIQNNVISMSALSGVKKLLFLGSSCVYPKYPKLPITEDQLMTGVLEPTNDAYAIAKIAGIKLCQSYNKQFNTNFISVMPTNVYGPNDNYDLESSHVLAALIRKISEAKENKSSSITLWGTGRPRREFLHSDDLAEACIYLMNKYNSSEIINIGTGKEISILDLAQKIIAHVEWELDIINDLTKPDGTLSKVMDNSKILNIGWKPKISLDEGITMTLDSYAHEIAQL
ncbi:MAG: GDP-L-fucose synthase [Candidatus Heimdallarchaeota archaeon]|nr:GDP-L-fucose synthase [Candidatus Heimdallarchaeota archaeon]